MIDDNSDIVNLLQQILRKLDDLQLLILLSKEIRLNEAFKDYPTMLKRLRIASEASTRPAIASDEISKLILKLLAMRGTLNISEIVREIKSIRGGVSRKSICKRLEKMEKLGILKSKIGWSKDYTINIDYQEFEQVITRNFNPETKIKQIDLK